MRLRNIPGAEQVILQSPYCIQNPKINKGKWADFFGNHHPIHIEIGMGKGQFLMNLAEQNPHINYIGIERYTSVLLRAVQKIEETPLSNVFFLCEDAEILPDIFGMAEIDRIYLNFSDPWPKDRHAKRRLTSSHFLERYEQILAKEGTIEFKTDNQDLFSFSLEEIKASCMWKLIAATRDLHHDSSMNQGNIMTEYEQKFSEKGNPICKLIACFEDGMFETVTPKTFTPTFSFHPQNKEGL